MKRSGRWALGTLAALGLVLGPAGGRSRADLFTASGVNGATGNTVAASADFSVDPVAHTLRIVLTNTTAGGTLSRGDILTGLFFTINGGNPSLTLTSTALTGGSVAFTDKSHSSTSLDLNGSYVRAQNPGGTLGTNSNGQDFPYEYGVSTVGASGIFKAGDLTKGSGGDDYGIIAAGTNTALSGFKTAFPLARDSITFVMGGLGSGLTARDITNVGFEFGSQPGAVIRFHTNFHTNSVPEPASMALIGLGLLGVAILGRRRRRPSA